MIESGAFAVLTWVISVAFSQSVVSPKQTRHFLNIVGQCLAGTIEAVRLEQCLADKRVRRLLALEAESLSRINEHLRQRIYNVDFGSIVRVTPSIRIIAEFENFLPLDVDVVSFEYTRADLSVVPDDPPLNLGLPDPIKGCAVSACSRGRFDRSFSTNSEVTATLKQAIADGRTLKVNVAIAWELKIDGEARKHIMSTVSLVQPKVPSLRPT